MRNHVFFAAGCSLLLGACFLSDFDAAERKERERSLPELMVTDVGSPARGGASGGQAGRGTSSSKGGSGGVGGAAGRSRVGGGGAAASSGRGPAAGSGGGSAAKGGSGAAAGGGASAGSGGTQASSTCGDTTSDVAHCGSCDNDCSADMALASCVDSRCTRACKPGFGDCNMDLTFGAKGDGCEIDLANNLAHCGACDVRCQPATGTVSFCEDKHCKAHTIAVGASAPVAQLHGNPTGGDPYDEVCGRDEAMIGLDVATNGDYIWGFAVRCAPVWLTGSADDFSIETGPSHALVLLSNRATPVQTPMTLECPTGMLVTGVTGATGYFLPMNQLLSVKTLSLICARTSINAGIELQPSSMQSAGSLMGNVAEPFSDLCPAGEVVVGFTGRAGDLVDAVMTQCAALDINDRVQ